MLWSIFASTRSPSPKVHKGHWHGDVAIKFLDMENLEDETTLEAFRLDVATFR